MTLKNTEPVFISLLPRSGSTLLSDILNQNDKLEVSVDRVHFMRWSYGKYRPIEKHYKRLVQDTKEKIQKRWNEELNEQLVFDKLAQKHFINEAIVYDTIMRSFIGLEDNDERRWVDRTAVAWESIPDFLEMFPKGKVIHIYRDPRAVLASFKRFTYHPGNMYLDIIFSSLAMFNFISKPEIKENQHVYLLKYEDLVKFPKKSINSLCKFLNVEFNDRMLRVDLFKDQRGQIKKANSSFFKTRKKIDTKSFDIWKEKLNNFEIYLTELIHGNKLKEFYYESMNVPINESIEQAMKELLKDDYIKKRYEFWKKFKDGHQTYPDTRDTY